ncbi:hypothetical protein CBL_07364 [Carabus blaptoides fortunei]
MSNGKLHKDESLAFLDLKQLKTNNNEKCECCGSLVALEGVNNMYKDLEGQGPSHIFAIYGVTVHLPFVTASSRVSIKSQQTARVTDPSNSVSKQTTLHAMFRYSCGIAYMDPRDTAQITLSQIKELTMIDIQSLVYKHDGTKKHVRRVDVRTYSEQNYKTPKTFNISFSICLDGDTSFSVVMGIQRMFVFSRVTVVWAYSARESLMLFVR